MIARLSILTITITSLAIVASACAEDEPMPDHCRLVVWYRPVQLSQQVALPIEPTAAERAVLRTSFDGWQTPIEFKRVDGGDGVDWRKAVLDLPPGTHDYGLDVGGMLLPDPNNTRAVFVQNPLAATAAPFDTEVSRVTIPDCGQPTLAFEGIDRSSADSLTWRARFTPGWKGSGVGRSSIEVKLRSGNRALDVPLDVSVQGDRISVTIQDLPPGKYTLSLTASDRDGQVVGPIESSGFVESEVAPRQLDDAIIYHVMVDRFWGDEGPLGAPSTIGMRAGGTLDGVRAMVEAGYFASLGVTTLWLSPVMENPTGIFRGRDGNLYEAYHGYWWLSPRAVEPAFGGEQALTRLVEAAHARGLRLVLDVVPNHLYAEHPYVLANSRLNDAIAQSENPGALSWFNDAPEQACVCGFDCPWAGNMETCWFDTYLLDVNQRNTAAAQAIVDDILWWSRHFDLDGVRVDAVPMMPRSATRALLRALRDQTARFGLDSLMLGEIFTGEGDGGRADIRFYLGPGVDGLDSAFDFPMLWRLRAAFAQGGAGLGTLEEELTRNEAFWGKSGSRLARIIGNHDTSRFISEAMGLGGADPWRAPPPQPEESDLYRRQFLALAFNFSLPGIPVIYYGDEVGLAGANDPDCRRVLPDVTTGEGLLDPQRWLLARVRELSLARGQSPALRRGARVPLFASDDWLAAFHAPALGFESEGGAITFFNRSASAASLAVEGLGPAIYEDLFSGHVVDLTSGAGTLVAPPESAAFYFVQGSRALTVGARAHSPEK
jgi:glycosidase